VARTGGARFGTTSRDAARIRIRIDRLYHSSPTILCAILTSHLRIGLGFQSAGVHRASCSPIKGVVVHPARLVQPRTVGPIASSLKVVRGTLVPVARAINVGYSQSRWQAKPIEAIRSRELEGSTARRRAHRRRDFGSEGAEQKGFEPTRDPRNPKKNQSFCFFGMWPDIGSVQPLWPLPGTNSISAKTGLVRTDPRKTARTGVSRDGYGDPTGVGDNANWLWAAAPDNPILSISSICVMAYRKAASEITTEP
jgi:hypothetical protein